MSKNKRRQVGAWRPPDLAEEPSGKTAYLLGWCKGKMLAAGMDVNKIIAEGEALWRPTRLKAQVESSAPGAAGR